jgi:DNA repair exonuclease SbcCD ATPase subunit
MEAWRGCACAPASGFRLLFLHGDGDDTAYDQCTKKITTMNDETEQLPLEVQLAHAREEIKRLRLHNEALVKYGAGNPALQEWCEKVAGQIKNLRGELSLAKHHANGRWGDYERALAERDELREKLERMKDERDHYMIIANSVRKNLFKMRCYRDRLEAGIKAGECEGMCGL